MQPQGHGQHDAHGNAAKPGPEDAANLVPSVTFVDFNGASAALSTAAAVDLATSDTVFGSTTKGTATVGLALGGVSLSSDAKVVAFLAGSIDESKSEIVCQSDDAEIVAGSLFTCSLVANDAEGNPTGAAFEATSVAVGMSGDKDLPMATEFGSKGAFPNSVRDVLFPSLCKAVALPTVAWRTERIRRNRRPCA